MYLQTFFILKGQKTVLTRLCSLLQNEIKDHENPSDVDKLKMKVVKQVEACINSTYSQLISNIELFTSGLSKLLPNLIEAKQSETTEKILKSILALNRVLRSFSVEQTVESEKVTEPIIHKAESVENSDFIICRICGEKIHVADIESHTELCIAAFKSESKVNDIDARLDNLIKEFMEGPLSTTWPGEESDAMHKILPQLSLLALSRRCKEITTDKSDAPMELTQIASIAKSMQSNDLCFLALEKSRTCAAFLSVAESLAKSATGFIPPKQPSLTEFTFLKRISGGAYARVFLAKKTQTGDIYAVKVLKRRSIQRKNQVQRVLTERDILHDCISPYVVSFYYSITGVNNLYLFMEYLPGGDLYSLLEQVGALDESSARFYIKQIIEALQFLHEHGIIHRDLKPDNLLITADGMLKLTDFGLSYAGAVGRQISSDERIIGTPDYVSPEVILCQSHGPTTDYWSLGCIAYELISGIPPFHRDTESMTLEAVITGRYEPIEDCSPELNDFITRLLDPDPERRLGAKGIEELKNHPWITMESDEPEEVPFVPSLSSPVDTNYFMSRYEFSEDDEKDIRSDMQAAQAAVEAKDEESKKDKKVPALRKRNRSGTVSKKKDELHNFEVVGIDQLGLQNQEAARLARRRSRAISDSFAPQSPMTIRLTNIAPAASSLDVAGPLKISAADDFLVSTPRRTIGDRFK
ncbi:AGC family protein kinase [Trichomonas vaginalis G3]|uniref:non-specific serine/threonine protein kinase n=1 Tax=Trichomonas vaginalis (strain ATCC PRA-98 / G3) TaxID=412133 RepID=A2FBN5_TRIV3|nr:STKc MAST like domain-containing protein [Trichomonas vaginalis G3]EAX97672.1 AGC family protein kinase [Trichomonas vaginalis G3]KAI5486331.1 STKc MAST like domain-containing protein [Trichomonas vaginalis G3]|eukprot:XP_001310602.1 AGC family protein kinase [Trichomonas vaginalis G3]